MNEGKLKVQIQKSIQQEMKCLKKTELYDMLI